MQNVNNFSEAHRGRYRGRSRDPYRFSIPIPIPGPRPRPRAKAFRFRLVRVGWSLLMVSGWPVNFLYTKN